MMLTTKGRYAVMAILEIASKSADKPIALAEIASKQNIPINYLEQIFIMLRKADIVRSVKGPGGGYTLHSGLDKLKIANIIDAVNENIEMTRCSGVTGNNCMVNNTKCKAHDLWHGLSNHIRHYFQAISVADVITGNNQLLNQSKHKKDSLKVEGLL